jgi:hypothetical protein
LFKSNSFWSTTKQGEGPRMFSHIVRRNKQEINNLSLKSSRAQNKPQCPGQRQRPGGLSIQALSASPLSLRLRTQVRGPVPSSLRVSSNFSYVVAILPPNARAPRDISPEYAPPVCFRFGDSSEPNLAAAIFPRRAG